MTAKLLIEILQQFPDDQVVELGFIHQDHPEEIIVLPIGEIGLGGRHVLILDERTSVLGHQLISVKLKEIDQSAETAQSES